MGSVANQNPYTPYDSYRDCSLGICSIYCPQFCYLIFPPPPPSDDDSAAPFSPLIIAIIGVLAGAVLLVGYYTVVTRYCKRRRTTTDGGHTTTTRTTGPGSDENQNESGQDIQYRLAPAGMDESLIKTIAVCNYRNGDGLIEDTECAVCLSEFQENEPLRLLPKCSHAFHLPCIDTWLKSHSNCPLCRANVVALANPCVSQPAVDLVLVVDDQELSLSQQNVVIINDDDANVDDDADDDVVVRIQEIENVGDSLGGAFSLPQRPVLVSDILKFEEIDEYMQVESDELWRGVGSSNGVLFGGEESEFGRVNRNNDGVLLLRSPVATKRCVSNGRFMSNKGKKSMLPN